MTDMIKLYFYKDAIGWIQNEARELGGCCNCLDAVDISLAKAGPLFTIYSFFPALFSSLFFFLLPSF